MLRDRVGGDLTFERGPLLAQGQVGNVELGLCGKVLEALLEHFQ